MRIKMYHVTYNTKSPNQNNHTVKLFTVIINQSNLMYVPIKTQPKLNIFNFCDFLSVLIKRYYNQVSTFQYQFVYTNIKSGQIAGKKKIFNSCAYKLKSISQKQYIHVKKISKNSSQENIIQVKMQCYPILLKPQSNKLKKFNITKQEYNTHIQHTTDRNLFSTQFQGKKHHYMISPSPLQKRKQNQTQQSLVISAIFLGAGKFRVFQTYNDQSAKFHSGGSFNATTSITNMCL
eukprot:TRINITY_DN4907_c0_g2_i1.p1 TRINITY_DN4907_c0_g2~~TRINITY_DN4907_c0_g2_i1.p1  ORF type:complete len:244 (+),score=-0.44 TRINITY_DN4907_c0_g2_i1:33-734(+)